MLNLLSIASLLSDDEDQHDLTAQHQQQQQQHQQQQPAISTPAGAVFGLATTLATTLDGAELVADHSPTSAANFSRQTMADLLGSSSSSGSGNLSSLVNNSHHLPTATQPGDTLPCFKDLFAVLFECFTIISLGYLSCRFKLISSEAKDLSSYLTTFALPMIIFLNIAQMEFQTINLSFLFCMLIAKLSLFVVVSLLTLATSYPTNSAYAGALSILATQSNDFALGYPLIKSLYGESKPEMLSYLSLMAPIQLLVLNPLGIIMLEYEKSARQNSSNSNNNNSQRRHSTASSIGSCRCELTGGGAPRPPSSRSSSSSPPRRDRSAAKSHKKRAAESESCRRTIGNNETVTNNDCSATTMPQRDVCLTRRRASLSSDSMNPSRNVCHQPHHDVSHQSKSVNTMPSATSAAAAAPSGAVHLDKSNHHQASFDQINVVSRQPPRATRFNAKALALVMPSAPTTAATLYHPSSETSIDSLDFAIKLDNNNDLLVLNSNNPDDDSIMPKVRYQLTPPAALTESSRASCKHHLVGTTEPKLLTAAIDHDAALARTSMRLNSNASQLSRRSSRPTCSACGRHNAGTRRGPTISCDFLKALITNPLIIASVVALTVNLVHGPRLPRLITKVSNTIAASFAAPALFVVGLSMHGKFELLVRSPNDLLLSSILVVTKVLILPSLMRTMAMLILPSHTPADEIPLLTDFAYLYGLLPTAPTACIIAKQYEVLTNVVSISMLLSTFISAPLMLATSVLINQSLTIKTETVQGLLAQTLRVSSVMTLVLSLVTLCFIWKASKRITYINFINLPEIICRTVNKIRQKNSTHLFTFLLILTQLIIGIGGSMWLFVDIKKLGHTTTPTTTTATPISSLLYQRLHHPDHLDSLHGNSLANKLLFDDTNYIPNDIDDDDDDVETLLMSQQQQHNNLEFMPSATRSSLKPHGLMIAPDMNSFGFNALCTMQYIFSSGGLVMAKFVILSIGLTIVVQLMCGHEAVNRLASLVMKIYAIVGIGTVALSVIGSKHLKCTPSEASLPEWPVSLYLRLIYDSILVVATIPILSLMFRSENKTNYLRQEALLEQQQQQDAEKLERDRMGGGCKLATSNQLAKRKFLTSTASLSSDTSSAMTSNTNLDSSSTPAVSLATQLSIQVDTIVSRKIQDTNNNHHHRDKMSPSNAMIDCEEFDRERSKSPDYGGSTSGEDNSQWFLNNKRNHHQQQHRVIEVIGDDLELGHTTSGPSIIPSQSFQQQQQTTDQDDYYLGIRHNHPIPFNKYSVLIVFMLIQVVLNLTTIIQMLNQEKPFGTFRQIEIANIALDFGQGLLTFLVVSSSWFPTKLISWSSSLCESSRS